MVGDSRPHEPEYRLNVDKIDWRDELVFLHQDMVRTHRHRSIAVVSLCSHQYASSM